MILVNYIMFQNLSFGEKIFFFLVESVGVKLSDTQRQKLEVQALKPQRGVQFHQSQIFSCVNHLTSPKLVYLILKIEIIIVLGDLGVDVRIK